LPDSELGADKGFLVGSFPLSIETPSQIASQVASVKLLGLGDEYLRLYRDRLAAVTALQARAAATRLYRRGALTIVVVGDGAKLYDRLRGIAPIRIVDVDGKSLLPADLTAPTGPVALDAAPFVAPTARQRDGAAGRSGDDPGRPERGDPPDLCQRPGERCERGSPAGRLGEALRDRYGPAAGNGGRERRPVRRARAAARCRQDLRLDLL